MPPSTSEPRVVTAGLLVANLVPLVGVVAFGWDLHSLLVGYWLESGVIGAAFVVKIRHAAGTDDPDDLLPLTLSGTSMSDLIGRSRGGIAGFFVGHYGMFWVGHGVVVWALPQESARLDYAAPDVVAMALVGLVLYHALSYRVNYIGQGEYRHTGPVTLMVEPYRRVIVLHMTVLFGGAALSLVGAPVGAVAVLVLTKTALDLWSHRKEHQRARDRGRRATAGSTD
jgi:hypothetical protein